MLFVKQVPQLVNNAGIKKREGNPREKIKARASGLSRVPLYRRPVLCLYGGGPGHLTNWYRSRGARVVAVDVVGNVEHRCKVEEFLDYYQPTSWHIVDIDPWGSPYPALKRLLERGHTTQYLAITDGNLLNCKKGRYFPEFVYNLAPFRRRTIPWRWHYRCFPMLVLHAVATLLAAHNVEVIGFNYFHNRWRSALYATLKLRFRTRTFLKPLHLGQC